MDKVGWDENDIPVNPRSMSPVFVFLLKSNVAIRTFKAASVWAAARMSISVSLKIKIFFLNFTNELN